MSSVRYQSTDLRQNEIYLLYTITRNFDHILWASNHVEWAESKTFKQSCDPLNYRIIFTNNNFKTNLYSGRNFGPQNITACQSLHWLWFVIDYSPLPDFYRPISFLDKSQQSSSFFNLVEVTLNGLLIAQFSFPANICLFLSATRKKKFAKLCWPVTLPGLWTDHVRRSHHSMTSNHASIL